MVQATGLNFTPTHREEQAMCVDNRPFTLAAVALLALLTSWGCTTLKGSEAGPELTSSATSEPWALSAPGRLGGGAEGFKQDMGDTNATIEATAGWPDALSEPGSWEEVRAVHEAAAWGGRSRAVAEHLRQEAAVKAFITENEADMAWRINSSVQATAAKSGQTVDAAGAIRYALRESTDAVARKRLHEHREAHAHIDAHEEQLGKRNVKPLREQADALLRASFFLYVAAPERAAALRRDLDEADAIKETLSEAIADQRAVEEDPKAARGDKRAAQKRREELEAALKELESSQAQAAEVLKGLDEELEATRGRYEAAIKALLKAERGKG